MLLRNLNCDGTQLHAPSPRSAVHELMLLYMDDIKLYRKNDDELASLVSVVSVKYVWALD